MMKFEIYCNYGVLAAEKRKVYTYGAEHAHAVCSDKLTVVLPDNDAFSLCEGKMGDLIVDTPWGWRYLVNEVLQGDVNPCFYAIDKDGKGHRVQLKIVEE